MKKDKNSFLESLASLLIVFAFLAVAYYSISEWIKHVKDPKTRVKTLVSTIITIIMIVMAYNHLSVEKKSSQPSLYDTYK
jgi:divalent metal cation (Fe/Co/Zn/Cd) transporter